MKKKTTRKLLIGAGIGAAVLVVTTARVRAALCDLFAGARFAPGDVVSFSPGAGGPVLVGRVAEVKPGACGVREYVIDSPAGRYNVDPGGVGPARVL